MDNFIFAMMVFAFVGAVTPGPVNLLATSTAVQQGSIQAFKHVLGASFAYAGVVYLSGSMLSTVSDKLPMLESSMQLVGSGFLIWLAYKIASAPVGNIEMEQRTTSGWVTGALAQLLNPKAWLVAMSGVSVYVVGQMNPLQWLWTFTFISLGACLIGVGVWALLGKLLAAYLSQPNKQRIFNRAMAIILVMSVSMMWL
ncbi:transporter [Vibrio variabilis]|uniref:Transporter n=1 Tax=Vibrio variabilis TaxID=990271 RepID=A0ABR4YFY7_9VIBR|nr:LysE family translocator [Vibrio variabilis]KHA62276.1 transporter [Vibrio variabilis]